MSLENTTKKKLELFYKRDVIINNSKIKNKMNGSKTKNHATFVAPDLQIKFKIQVQNTIYNIFIANIIVTLGTSQDNEPKQYILRVPIF